MQKVNLFFCGDVAIQKGNEFSICSNLKTEIVNSDFAICNFEGPEISIESQKYPKSGPHIGQETGSIRLLKDVGFNVFSLANNHIMDFGESAIKKTLDTIKLNKCYQVGVGDNYLNSYEPLILRKNGISIAIFAAGENEFGCNFEEGNKYGFGWLFSEALERQIISYKIKCDFLVLNAHAGVENIEFPLVEWQRRYRLLCDLGIDVIVGHHPHVPQGIETYKNSTIFYSLGNFHFITDHSTLSSLQSFSVKFEFDNSKTYSYQLLYHTNENGFVKQVSKEDVQFDIEYLNDLCGERLLSLNEKKSLEVYENYYEGYYRTAIGAPSSKRTFFSDIKFLVKFFVRKRRLGLNQLLLLLHNIKIDSHRFIVQRALSIMSNQLK